MAERRNERLRTDKAYNLHIVNRYDCGASGMPQIWGEDAAPQKLVSFNYSLSMSEEKKRGAFCHFFIDDYQFERVWSHPEQYVKTLGEFDGVLTPDFSLYVDMPLPMQAWNVYRSRALGHWWQDCGLKVIPTVGWSTSDSYDFCFDGLPAGSVIAVSTVGIMVDKEARELWSDGMKEAIKRLEPSCVVVYGKLPDFDFGGVPTVSFQSGMTERISQWADEVAARQGQEAQHEE